MLNPCEQTMLNQRPKPPQSLREDLAKTLNLSRENSAQSAPKASSIFARNHAQPASKPKNRAEISVRSLRNLCGRTSRKPSIFSMKTKLKQRPKRARSLVETMLKSAPKACSIFGRNHAEISVQSLRNLCESTSRKPSVFSLKSPWKRIRNKRAENAKSLPKKRSKSALRARTQSLLKRAFEILAEKLSKSALRAYSIFTKKRHSVSAICRSESALKAFSIFAKNSFPKSAYSILAKKNVRNLCGKTS